MTTSTQLPPLIPRSVLFGPPARVHPALSPDGARIAFVAPVAGIPNLWVETIGGQDARPLTREHGAGVHAFDWAPDGRHLLCQLDNDGDENTHLFRVDVQTGELTDLTPFPGIRARFLGVAPSRPHHVLLAISHGRTQLPDVHLADLSTGELTLVAENPGFAGWYHDQQLRVRGAFRWEADGGLTILVRDEQDWRPLHGVKPEESTTTRVIGFSTDGTGVSVLSSADAETVRLLRYDLATGVGKVIYEDPVFDVGGVGLSPSTGEADLVIVERERRHLEAIDPALAGDVARLRRFCGGDAILLGRDPTDRTWLIMDYVDDGPARYYVYDRSSKRLRLLFSHNPVLDRYRLAHVEPFSFLARDGLTIHGYLTFPPGVPRTDLPTVLAVHGGPWARDQWGAGGDAQWLANRGYLCVQVNFRGSTGYGKDFVNAGDREWGGRMQDDLLDAVDWVVGRGFADRDRVAVYGSSYGGYAALAGAAFTPGVFRCAIAVCAPVNLLTFVAAAIDGARPMAPRIRRRIGDPDIDQEFLWSRSPLSRIDDIAVPLLIAHGANDPRVPRDEAEQLVEALRRKEIPHEYLLFPDEGHSFMKPGNKIRFYTAAERFLSEHLGGRYEP